MKGAIHPHMPYFKNWIYISLIIKFSQIEVIFTKLKDAWKKKKLLDKDADFFVAFHNVKKDEVLHLASLSHVEASSSVLRLLDEQQVCNAIYLWSLNSFINTQKQNWLE